MGEDKSTLERHIIEQIRTRAAEVHVQAHNYGVQSDYLRAAMSSHVTPEQVAEQVAELKAARSNMYELPDWAKRGRNFLFQYDAPNILSKFDEYQEAERMISNGYSQDPEAMERAALGLVILAQRIKDFDALEPTGEEPVITWKHQFSEEGRIYTYVAVKLGDLWYMTGDRQARTSYRWRDFLDLDFATPLTTGDFLLVTKWSPVR